jgi:hypothetical protein
MALPLLAQLNQHGSNNNTASIQGSNTKDAASICIAYSRSNSSGVHGSSTSSNGSCRLRLALTCCIVWNFVQALLVLDFKQHQTDGRCGLPVNAVCQDL